MLIPKKFRVIKFGTTRYKAVSDGTYILEKGGAPNFHKLYIVRVRKLYNSKGHILKVVPYDRLTESDIKNYDVEPLTVQYLMSLNTWREIYA